MISFSVYKNIHNNNTFYSKNNMILTSFLKAYYKLIKTLNIYYDKRIYYRLRCCSYFFPPDRFIDSKLLNQMNYFLYLVVSSEHRHVIFRDRKMLREPDFCKLYWTCKIYRKIVSISYEFFVEEQGNTDLNNIYFTIDGGKLWLYNTPDRFSIWLFYFNWIRTRCIQDI